MGRTRRSLRWLVVLAVPAAVVAPVALDRASFPLSTYPIYASVRPREVTFIVASGIDRSGRRMPLGLDAVAGTDDPLIAQSTLDRAVADGTADTLCERIAERSEGVRSIEIARERHDLVDRVRDLDSLRERSVVARCEVTS